ncbi:MAG TPA: PIN domain-containing protein [Anaerolineae bacterium]|nr:PIN domain-containing protein [Anaerolineae bacterium]
MTQLEDALTGVVRLGLDTAPIIYFVEAHPRYDALVTEVFQRIADGGLVGVTSVISVTEVLAQPIRRGDLNLQRQYLDLLRHSDNIEIAEIDLAVAERAAELRARHNLRTPDALQMAVALLTGCQAFLTNDMTLQRVTDLSVLVLDELSL